MQQPRVDWLRRLESRCITYRKKMVLHYPGELACISASAIQATWPCPHNPVRLFKSIFKTELVDCSLSFYAFTFSLV